MKKNRTKKAPGEHTPVALASLDSALIAEDERLGTVALGDLVANHANWTRLLARLKSLSDPANPKTDPETTIRRCMVLFKSAINISESASISASDILWVKTLAITTIRNIASLARLRELLRTLTFFSDSLSTQTFRLAVLLEHQHRQLHKLAIERGLSQGTYHPYAVLDHFLPTRTGGNANLLGAYEELVEAVELALRYSHHSAPLTVRNGPLVPKVPFLDPDLQRTIIAAGIWRAIVDIHGAVKYAGWSTHELSSDHACYAPRDEAEYLRHRVGDVREQAILTQFSSEATDLTQVRAHHRALLAIRPMIKYPGPGETWNGKYPKELGTLIKGETEFSAAALAWIRFRHYEPFARAIRIDGGKVGWEPWFLARSAINVLATLFAFYLSPPGQERADDDWRRYVVIVRKRDLVEVARESGITKGEAEAAVDSMTFDQKRTSLELWDQPLLPISGERLILVPSLLSAASPTRLLENSIAQWAPGASASRGIPFEGDILRDVQSLGFGAAAKNVIIRDVDGKEIQYDVVWLWDGHLFLMETKCLQSVHEFSDHARAKASIEYGFTQLARRKQAAKTQWEQLRGAIPQLQLPQYCPSDSNITCIVLTNITSFTTWVTSDGFIVTDDICFRRYFGDPAINARRLGSGAEEESVVHLGDIRDSAPSPEKFVSYLHDPPQCRSVRTRLQAKMVENIASETHFPIWQMMVEYHPDLGEWYVSRKTPAAAEVQVSQ
ncbi:hypothetical protein WMF20_15725 [Sorangium sp. So ce834]|uniref:hypothetical protein n=1 Tax=Sorangium sp. So ce834 TaxID=3133321 RepID=UPI003F5F6F08